MPGGQRVLLRKLAKRALKSADNSMGLRAWVAGEPRPPKGGFDLDGEKLIDWGWICVNLPPGPKRALEIGPGKSPIIPAMLALGYDVTAVDLSSDISTLYSNIRFHVGDFKDLASDQSFDVVVLCSAVEHIGLSGRYNSQEEPDGDLRAMRKVWELLQPEGRLFLTIPVGKDTVHRPWHRIYGKVRLKKLLNGFLVVQSRYLIKEPWGPWHIKGEEEALSFGPDVQRYALGEFILQKRDSLPPEQQG